MYERCLEWARRHGASFAPKKYTLMHFTKETTKHIYSSPLIFPTSTIYPSPSACVLGIILDKKFSWRQHLHHIKSKLATQTNILSRLTASTWGTSLQVSWLLYTAVIRPVTTTGCPALRAPSSTTFFHKGVWDELQRVENHCLKSASVAYKATPVQCLWAKVGVPLLPLHLDGRQAHFCLRFAESGLDRVIEEGILKDRQFLSCTRLQPRHPRMLRNWQTASNPHLLVPPSPHPTPLAASQLSWVQQWVPQDDPQCPATISTRANCTISALWL
jgi:hypothetical protein